MRGFLIAACFITLSPPAHAQLILPGAVAPSPEGTVQSQEPSKLKPTFTVNKIAGVDAVAGRALHLNGAFGTIELSATGDHLDLTKLTLAGNMISRPGDACQVDVITNTSTPLTPLGKPDGLLRYENSMAACSFSVEILHGAILVKTEADVCSFTAADCQVRPSGMWGPAAASIGAEQINADIKARTNAETALRASFRDLMERHSDRASIRTLASEQAAFSSDREDMCRDYVREDQHGFCATRFTEAKVANLRMRLGDKSETDATRAKAKPHKKHFAPPIAGPEPLQLN